MRQSHIRYNKIFISIFLKVEAIQHMICKDFFQHHVPTHQTSLPLLDCISSMSR